MIDVFPYRMYLGNPYNMWIETYSMARFQTIFFLVSPILAAMGVGDLYRADENSGYINHIFAKGSRKAYFTRLYLGNFMVGGLCFVLPLVFNLYCCFMLLPNRAPDMVIDDAVNVTLKESITIFPELYYNHPLLHVGLYLIIGFLLGALYSTMALCAGFILKNRFFVVLTAFIISYVYTAASFHIDKMGKYVPKGFEKQLGGCNDPMAIIIFFSVGFSITTIVYILLARKRCIQ